MGRLMSQKVSAQDFPKQKRQQNYWLWTAGLWGTWTAVTQGPNRAGIRKCPICEMKFIIFNPICGMKPPQTATNTCTMLCLHRSGCFFTQPPEIQFIHTTDGRCEGLSLFKIDVGDIEVDIMIPF